MAADVCGTDRARPSFRADFEPAWGEVRDRLREELDYVNEAQDLRRMAALWAGSAELMIPDVKHNSPDAASAVAKGAKITHS